MYNVAVQQYKLVACSETISFTLGGVLHEGQYVASFRT